MKRVDPGQHAAGGKRSPSLKGSRLSAIPMEWMDPMSWRLPSGKALAEFALQAGFLAPLMLSGPPVKRPRKAAAVPLPAGPENRVAGSPVGPDTGEEPEVSGTFREGGFRQGGIR
jgi:hypothetical protein